MGNAVVRNRVKRRLRHLAREHVSRCPGSAVLVVRALPAGGRGVRPAELAADLDPLSRAGCGRSDVVKYLLIGLLRAYRL